MSKRHKVEGVFKLLGVWWKHIKYKKNGVWKHCYSPRHSYEPVFSDKKLTKEDLASICKGGTND